MCNGAVGRMECLVLVPVSKAEITCDVKDCGESPDFAYYPNGKRQEFLRVTLCLNHRNMMVENRAPKEQIYRSASLFVTKSLV